MKFIRFLSVIAIVWPLAIAVPAQLTAQQRDHKAPQHILHFKFVDLGTLGGPTSLVQGGSIVANNREMVAAVADTADSNPNFENFNPLLGQDLFVSHAAIWSNGKLRDLGALPGGFNSVSVTINAAGIVEGASENGETDPLLGVPAIHAVVWRQNVIQDLGTLGGYESVALQVTNSGKVIGMATNSIPDSLPDPTFGISLGAQVRAFLWERGSMTDLGTLGGPDAGANYVNERGQVTGVSYTSNEPDPSGAPPTRPFIWEDGKMEDLGSLGGTFGFSSDISNRGEIVGLSNLAGDAVTHPFLWTREGKMRDLGTLGGDNGEASWINDGGEIAGDAELPGSQVHHAFLWKNGVMTDLGTIANQPCSAAFSINNLGQVIGGAGPCGEGGHSFLWEHGTIIDLSTFLPPDSGIILQEPDFISDRGEIVGRAILPNGDAHAFAMIPCEPADADRNACRSANSESESQAMGTQRPLPSPFFSRELENWKRRRTRLR